jgi:hypothetical protein
MVIVEDNPEESIGQLSRTLCNDLKLLVPCRTFNPTPLQRSRKCMTNKLFALVASLLGSPQLRILPVSFQVTPYLIRPSLSRSCSAPSSLP